MKRGGYFERLQGEMVALDQMQANLTVAIHKRDSSAPGCWVSRAQIAVHRPSWK